MTSHDRLRRHALLAATLSSLLLLAGMVQCRKRPDSAAPAAPRPSVLGSTAPRQLYGQTVVLNAGAKPALERAAHDMVDYLSRATGAPFELRESGQRGIFLVHSAAPDAPADIVERLRGQGRGAYAIRSIGDGKLLIVANADDGLIFGAYQYLESLGVRFYFPNERWTIVPRLDSIERAEDRVVKPAFRLRQFNGTGGFGKALVVDPQGELARRWSTWKRRNGFGEEFHIDGHAGEGFNVRNKQALVDNPDFLASVKGKRAPWSRIAKLDPSSPKAVDLFVQDRLAAYRAKKQRDPDGPGSFAVSVETADGGGHCDSPECEEIGTVSDRVFHVANAVARALRKEDPNAKASLFAYNLHADVPQIPIEPNVYVMLVPYAFQRSGVDPEEFIIGWKKKKSPLSIYDYWSIPDWVADQPEFDYREIPVKKLRFWHEQGIEGFLSESTYSAGAMGLAWYLAGHLMWDPGLDPNALANAFFRDAFASAAPAMRRMLERWAEGFYLSSLELRASFADLAEAFARSPDAAVTARIEDYAGYVQYLRLRHEWQTAAKPDKPDRKRALVVHLWRLYSSAMLHTFRLQQLLLRKDAELRAELDPTKPDLPIWQALTAVTEADVRAWVDAGLRDYPDLGVAAKSYVGALVPAPHSADTVQHVASPTPPLTLVGTNRLELTLASAHDALTMQIKAGAELRVRLLASDGAVIARTQLRASALPETFAYPPLAAGSYVLELRTTKRGVTGLTFPSGVAVELKEFRIPKAVKVPDLYFYVPKAERAIALYDSIALPAGSGASLIDPSGHEAPLERLDGGHLLIARVPPEQRDRIWTLRRAVAPDGSLRLLNVPQRLALAPRALRVPRDALSPVPARR